MAEIIDLDKLISAPKKAKLGGKTYTLPAEIPVPLYLAMKAQEKVAAENPDSGQDIVEGVHEQALALFQVYQPDLEVLPVGILQLMRIIPAIYGSGMEDDGEDPKPRKKTRARTGSASSTRRRTRSAS